MSNNIEVQFDDLIDKFDLMANEIQSIGKTALNVGAYNLKTAVKSAFASKMPASTKPVRQQTISRGYKITSGEPLVDAVRQTKEKVGIVKVHILGSRQPNSSQFIARFYEGGTKDRYQKTHKGKKLRKPKFIGRLEAKHFFMPTVEEQTQNTISTIESVIINKTNDIFNG